MIALSGRYQKKARMPNGIALFTFTCHYFDGL